VTLFDLSVFLTGPQIVQSLFIPLYSFLYQLSRGEVLYGFIGTQMFRRENDRTLSHQFSELFSPFGVHSNKRSLILLLLLHRGYLVCTFVEAALIEGRVLFNVIFDKSF